MQTMCRSHETNYNAGHSGEEGQNNRAFVPTPGLVSPAEGTVSTAQHTAQQVASIPATGGVSPG